MASAQIDNKMDPQVQPFSTFTCFPKLPVELRLAIWALCAPEPAVVLQHQGSKGLQYLRTIPPVLHTCRESRTEFLELDDDTEDVTKQRRARQHPIYKLSFRSTRRMRGPATFFCSEIDTFWATQFVHSGNWHHRHTFGLLEKLDIAATLKHLIVPHSGISYALNAYSELCKAFPMLETVTLALDNWTWVVDNSDINHPKANLQKFALTPELNGELTTTSLAQSHLDLVNICKHDAKDLYGAAKDANYKIFRYSPPKFRFHDQIISNSGIVIPPAKFEEDFDDDDPKPVPVTLKRSRGKKDDSKPVKPKSKKPRILDDDERAFGSFRSRHRRRR